MTSIAFNGGVPPHPDPLFSSGSEGKESTPSPAKRESEGTHRGAMGRVRAFGRPRIA